MIPANIISGTYINSNIIVHSKHIDSASVQPTHPTHSKKNSISNRVSNVQDERKVIPADQGKPIVASGGVKLLVNLIALKRRQLRHEWGRLNSYLDASSFTQLEFVDRR